MPSTDFALTLPCPKCGGGIAYATFADENGTNRQCFACSHGFTQPASEDTMSSPPIVSDATASEHTPGNPGAGSVLPDGSDAGRAVESKHADAGPSVTPVYPTGEPETPPEGSEGTAGGSS